MIYYSTQRVLLTAGHESQGLNDAIQRGLNALSSEAGGQPVILVDVVPVVMRGWFKSKICIVILAKPYEPEKPQTGIEDLLGQAMAVEGGRGIIEKIIAVLRESGKIEENEEATRD